MSNLVVTHFNSGVVTPQVDARSDIEKYPGACRICNNMIPDLYGNATRRPGTTLIQSGNGAGCYFVRPPIAGVTGISTPQELQDMQNGLNGDYELLNDIDMSGFDWSPIGAIGTAFSGSIDGRYYTISNLTINKTVDEQGLFGKATTGATIDNIFITGASIVNTEPVNRVGLLVGNSTDITVTNCYVQGTITLTGATASTRIGGLIGSGPATCIRCSAIIDITSSSTAVLSNAGGFIGTASGSFTDCYAQGSITYTSEVGFGFSNVGGFGGLDGGGGNSFVNCYSAVVITGTEYFAVGGFLGSYDEDDPDTFEDNFWDITIEPGKSDIGHQGEQTDSPNSSPANIDGITSETTASMFLMSTFTNWDFKDIWMIDKGSDYPVHQWRSRIENCLEIT